MTETPFVPLHIHTDYSMLQSACNISKLAGKLTDFGIKAAALTEKPDIYKGEQNGRAKLTTENVKEIRRLYETGLSQTRLGEMFGVCQTVVSKIVLRKSWEHVE